jgi:hypothetical protein
VGRAEGRIQAAEFDKEQVASTTAVTRENTAHEAHFAVLQLEQADVAAALRHRGHRRGQALRGGVQPLRDRTDRIDNLYIAQNEKDQARTQYVQALRQYWQAYYQLRRLTLLTLRPGVPSNRRLGRLGRLVAALSALSASSATAQALDSAPAAPRRATTSCVVSRLSDGDTLRCQGGARVRLIGSMRRNGSRLPFSEVALNGSSRWSPSATRSSSSPTSIRATSTIAFLPTPGRDGE